MKILTSLFILLLGSWSFAATTLTPLSLDGIYHFNGQLNNFSVQENRVVYGFTEEGTAQLQDLQNQGFTCANTGRGIYLCQRAEASTTLSAKVQARLEQKFQNLSVSFLKHTAPAPSLQIDAPDLTEWTISQDVKMDAQSWDHFRYQILDGSLHKIALGDAGVFDTQYFVVVSANELQYAYSEAETVANGYLVYTGFATLSK